MSRPDLSLTDEPALDFLRLLWRVEHALQRASKAMEASMGITGPQRLVIRVVGRHPGIRARDLSDLVHLHPSTVSGIVKRLEQSGLLIREQDPKDTRSYRLRLQPAARPLAGRQRGTVESAVATVMANYSKGDLQNARTLLDALAESIEGVAAMPAKSIRR